MKGKLKIAEAVSPWWEIKALSGEAAEIWLYSDIGEDWWGDGTSTSARQFVQEINALRVTSIALHIYSGGGDFFDAQAIYAAIRNHPASVTTYIDALAASAASQVALAGDHIVMAANSWLMYHSPYGSFRGTASAARAWADVLERLGGTMAAVYEARSTLSAEEVVAAMEAETWCDAEEALALGFVDEIGDELQIAARVDIAAYGYKHVPEPLIACSSPASSAVESEEHTQPAAGAAPVDQGGSPSIVRPEAFIPTGLGPVHI